MKNKIIIVLTCSLFMTYETTAQSNQPGAINPAFGSTGPGFTLFDFPPGGGFDDANAMVIDSQGRILLAGQSTITGTNDFALARFSPDGVLDTNFGGTGPGFTLFEFVPGVSVDIAHAIVIDSQDRILLAGQSTLPGSSNFALARFSPDGVLDTSFGSTGPGFTLFDFPPGGGFDVAFSMVLDNQGRIVLAGQSDALGTLDFALARFSPDGVLDTSFGGTGPGFTLFDFPPGGGSDIARAMALDSQVRIVLAGNSNAEGTTDFALARFSPDGVLDTSFGGTGPGFTLFDFPPGGGTDIAFAIVLDSQARIILGGQSNASGPFDDFALARFSPDGVLDSNFGGTGPGFTLLKFPPGAGIARAIALDSQARILLAGQGITVGTINFALARFNSNGIVDNAFGTTGPGFTLFDLPPGGADIARAMIINSQGHILLAGNSDTAGTVDFALAEFFGEEFDKCTLAIREKYCFLP